MPEAPTLMPKASEEEEQSWRQLLQHRIECLANGEDPWVDSILKSPCPRKAALSMLKEFKDAAESQGEILRNKLRALQNEVRELKKAPAVSETEIAEHVATPPQCGCAFNECFYVGDETCFQRPVPEMMAVGGPATPSPQVAAFGPVRSKTAMAKEAAATGVRHWLWVVCRQDRRRSPRLPWCRRRS